VSSYNSLDIFDNQAIAEKVRDEYEKKYSNLKTQLANENSTLQDYLS
jgi:hypothetical protein